jgi:hypothetical protein
MMARRDLSLAHFLREAASAVTDLDSALIRSLGALIARPGRLTAAYLGGDRHRYLTPFRVFLFCNLLYFVAASAFHINILTTSYRGHVDEMFYNRITRSVVEHRYGIRHVPPSAERDSTARPAIAPDRREASLEARFNGATEGVGKVSVALLIPLFALLLTILYAGTNHYVAEHVVFATHLVAALLVAIPVLGFALLGVEAIIYLITHAALGGETVLVIALLLPLAVYVAMAQRVVYRAGWVANVVRTALLAASIAYVIPAFKFVLFFVTLYWIGR